MYLILDTITKLFAPILCFTCDEIWQAMPHKNEDDQRNVVLNVMNEPFMEYALPEEEMAKWDALETLRDGVNAALESARAQKKIGKSLEAKVTLVTQQPQPQLDGLKAAFENQWADLFIVSQVEVKEDKGLYSSAAETPVEGVRVLVEEAAGQKCERCWKHDGAVGQDAAHPTLCPRCAQVVSKMGL